MVTHVTEVIRIVLPFLTKYGQTSPPWWSVVTETSKHKHQKILKRNEECQYSPQINYTDVNTCSNLIWWNTMNRSSSTSSSKCLYEKLLPWLKWDSWKLGKNWNKEVWSCVLTFISYWHLKQTNSNALYLSIPLYVCAVN